MGIDPKGESFMNYVGNMLVGGIMGTIGGLILGTGVGAIVPPAAPVTMAVGTIGGGMTGIAAGAYLSYKQDHKKKETYDNFANPSNIIGFKSWEQADKLQLKVE